MLMSECHVDMLGGENGTTRVVPSHSAAVSLSKNHSQGFQPALAKPSFQEKVTRKVCVLYSGGRVSAL